MDITCEIIKGTFRIKLAESMGYIDRLISTWWDAGAVVIKHEER